MTIVRLIMLCASTALGFILMTGTVKAEGPYPWSDQPGVPAHAWGLQ